MTPDNAKVEAALASLKQVSAAMACPDLPRRLRKDEVRWAAAITEALATLTAALAEREKDAGRYRWLRDHRDEEGFVDPEIHVAVDSHKFPNQWALVGEDLDAAIDAAMQGESHD